MARSDWNQYGEASTSNSLSAEQVYEGATSLKGDASYAGENAEILAVSEDDAPAEARLITYAYVNDTVDAPLMMAARFQGPDNYYAAGFTFNDDTTVISLNKKVTGGWSAVDTVNVGEFAYLNTALSDGSTSIYEQWTGPWRLTLWEDSGGDVRFRVEEDLDDDGTWTIYERDLVDTAPDFSSGGGVGLVMSSSSSIIRNNGSTYFDATEIYY